MGVEVFYLTILHVMRMRNGRWLETSTWVNENIQNGESSSVIDM